ncbi:MAG: enoyl-CoA hydratase/isomerase family protein [Euryarchaeota archaeon]|jgi:enoyl-CoA hydratase/carnithine racemase
MVEGLVTIERIETQTSPEGGCIEIWTLNRPDRLNALNRATHQELIQACDRAESNDNVRVVVITGAHSPQDTKRPKPKSFAAGADIAEFSGKSSDDVRPFFENNAWEKIWNLTKPTIAMVDGYALGGGTELALSCDIRIASEDSNFGQPEINLGLIPGGGGTQRLTKIVGYGHAMELILTGDMIPANRALEIGLVNSVVPSSKLRGEVIALATKIAEKSPYTIKVAKRAIRSALDLPLTQGILAERSEFVALFDTEDSSIGVEAFLSKQKPEWVGK